MYVGLLILAHYGALDKMWVSHFDFTPSCGPKEGKVYVAMWMSRHNWHPKKASFILPY